MITYFSWWYGEELAYLWRATIITAKKTFWSFSIPLLLRTLFDPWKRDQIYRENASLDARFRIMLNNLVSRGVGFILRLSTILVGLLFFFIVAILCVLIDLIWILFPLIIIGLIIFGYGRWTNGYI